MQEMYWHAGAWSAERTALLGSNDNAFWMSTVVFDGARVVRGLAPDLGLHCERAVRSAEQMMLRPAITADELTEVCREGARLFPGDSQLYVRPMFFARDGFLMPDASSTECAVCILEVPLPFGDGMTAAISPFRRPAPDMAPTDAKASCLYPNMLRAMAWANERGADTAIVLNPDGSIGEFASANIFIVDDGVVYTPEPNGSILAGLTRARVISLLADHGVKVVETVLHAPEIYAADEVFATGNHIKVVPVTRIDHRNFEPGPLTALATERYWEFAATQPL